MSEGIVKRAEVKTFREALYCRCGEEMRMLSKVTLTCPAIFHYTCDKCGYEHSSKNKYPRTVYEEVEV